MAFTVNRVLVFRASHCGIVLFFGSVVERLHLFSSSTALIVSAAILSTSAAFGQSLSIVRKADTNYWIEATAPTDAPQTLQASENLHLWVDIQTEIQDTYAYQLDGAEISHRYFRLVPATPPAAAIRVMLIGDSLSTDCCGWGGGVYGYFKTNENVTVINYAVLGDGTKTFLSSDRRDNMLLIKPNYVLIDYGSVEGQNYPNVYTTPEEFMDNLRTIAQLVRGFDGVPIFVTIHAARSWDATGHLVPVELWLDRNGLTKQVAAEIDAPVVDLYQLTWDLFTQLGPDGTAFMHYEAAGPEDVMHLSPLGARYVARLVVNALPDELGPYLTGILDPPPKP